VKLPAEWDDVAEVVAQELELLDSSKRRANWKYRALGATVAEVVAEVPTKTRLDVNVPVGELRVVRRLAEARGLTLRAYLRRALATAVVCDGVDPADVPVLTKGGPLRPRLS